MGKVDIKVSRSNWNRWRFNTASIDKILKSEGYDVMDNLVFNEGKLYNISNVQITPKAKRV